MKEGKLKRKPAHVYADKTVKKEVRAAAGVPDKKGNLSVKGMIELDPAIQDIIKTMSTQDYDENTIDNSAEIAATKGMGPSQGVTHDAMRERNDTIIRLARMGVTPGTIRGIINSQDAVKHRGILKQDNRIRDIISEYYRRNAPSAETRQQNEDTLKELMFEQQFKTIENIALWLNKKIAEGDIKNGDFILANDVLLRARQQMIENKNWNASRQNPFAVVDLSGLNYQITNGGNTLIINRPASVQRLLDKIEEVEAKNGDADSKEKIEFSGDEDDKIDEAIEGVVEPA